MKRRKREKKRIKIDKIETLLTPAATEEQL